MSVSQNSSLLLTVALLFMIQLLPSTRAAPISCKNDSRKSEKFKNCAELYKCGQTISGVYTIDPADGKGAFNVYCDQTTDGGGWTVIQKRVNDTVDFNRTWKDYKNGFGDFLIRGFWLGLEKIQRLTQNKTENKFRVDLGVTASKTVYAQYEWFGIESETAYYKLRIGNVSSKTVKDSLSTHNGMSFGTWDKPSTNLNCAWKFGGGWWFLTNACGYSNLNGIYPHRGDNRQIHWAELNGNKDGSDTAPRTTEMKIRPVDFESWTSDGGGLTMIQKRVDDTADFNRAWKDYKNGFGDFLIGDFWLGLEKMQRLTQNKKENKLRVDLGVTANKTGHAEYERFGIENEIADYKLRIGGISSATVNDSLSNHNGMFFGISVCAPRLRGGWWYLRVDKVCTVSSNLNSFYPPRWGKINSKPENALRTTKMKVRRKDFLS